MMDKRTAGLLARHLERAIHKVRDAVGELNTTPDSPMDNDLGAVTHDLHNSIARLEALRAECQVYATAAEAGVS